MGDLVTIMSDNTEGRKIEISIIRDGETETIEVDPFSERFIRGQGMHFIQAQIGIGPTQERRFLGVSLRDWIV